MLWFLGVVLVLGFCLWLFPERALHISFFGGEPTLEHDAIVKFSKKLLTTLPEKVPYSASMTTNGYLLTPDRFRELVDCKITSYQITVDGTEDNHNKTRVVANGRGSWSRIIENLKAARDSELDFAVSIRTNFTPESVSLADARLLAENFQADMVALHGVDGLVKIRFKKAHDGRDLVFRALPVFGRKRVDGEIL